VIQALELEEDAGVEEEGDVNVGEDGDELMAEGSDENKSARFPSMFLLISHCDTLWYSMNEAYVCLNYGYKGRVI
jgi:hypothetical protein